MNVRIQSGFTLWELLVAVFVAGILLGIGVPSFREFQRNNGMVTAANDLVTGILMARTEAVKRQVPVTLCASPNPIAANPTCSPTGAGSNGGFIVWVDENGNTDGNGVPILTDGSDGNAVVDGGETILLQRDAPGGVINVWGDAGYIAYGPNGFARIATGLGFGSLTRVLYCDERGNRATTGGSSARVVRVDPTGRGQVLREIADVTAAIVIINGAGVATTCP